MGVGYASGKNKTEAAAEMAIKRPRLETSINGAKSDLDILLKYYAPEKIVVMNSMQEEQETEYIFQATNRNIPTHSIRKDGPLLVNTPVKRKI